MIFNINKIPKNVQIVEYNDRTEYHIIWDYLTEYIMKRYKQGIVECIRIFGGECGNIIPISEKTYMKYYKLIAERESK